MSSKLQHDGRNRVASAPEGQQDKFEFDVARKSSSGRKSTTKELLVSFPQPPVSASASLASPSSTCSPFRLRSRPPSSFPSSSSLPSLSATAAVTSDETRPTIFTTSPSTVAINHSNSSQPGSDSSEPPSTIVAVNHPSSSRSFLSSTSSNTEPVGDNPSTPRALRRPASVYSLDPNGGLRTPSGRLLPKPQPPPSSFSNSPGSIALSSPAGSRPHSGLSSFSSQREEEGLVDVWGDVEVPHDDGITGRLSLKPQPKRTSSASSASDRVTSNELLKRDRNDRAAMVEATLRVLERRGSPAAVKTSQPQKEREGTQTGDQVTLVIATAPSSTSVLRQAVSKLSSPSPRLLPRPSYGTGSQLRRVSSMAIRPSAVTGPGLQQGASSASTVASSSTMSRQVSASIGPPRRVSAGSIPTGPATVPSAPATPPIRPTVGHTFPRKPPPPLTASVFNPRPAPSGPFTTSPLPPPTKPVLSAPSLSRASTAPPSVPLPPPPAPSYGATLSPAPTSSYLAALSLSQSTRQLMIENTLPLRIAKKPSHLALRSVSSSNAQNKTGAPSSPNLLSPSTPSRLPSLQRRASTNSLLRTPSANGRKLVPPIAPSTVASSDASTGGVRSIPSPSRPMLRGRSGSSSTSYPSSQLMNGFSTPIASSGVPVRLSKPRGVSGTPPSSFRPALHS